MPKAWWNACEGNVALLSRLARIALLFGVALLIWNVVLQPATRQRIRSYVEILAFALLASSALMLGWQYLYG